VKFQDRLQRDMTAEIESDETSSDVAKELLELGLIHEVIKIDKSIHSKKKKKKNSFFFRVIILVLNNRFIKHLI
jgi:hypothetical protein